MTSENQIRTIIEQWAKAGREEDMNGVLKNHHKDIVMFDSPYPLQSKGIEEYKKTWELFFNWTKQPKVFDIIEMEITSTNDLAFAMVSSIVWEKIRMELLRSLIFGCPCV